MSQGTGMAGQPQALSGQHPIRPSSPSAPTNPNRRRRPRLHAAGRPAGHSSARCTTWGSTGCTGCSSSCNRALPGGEHRQAPTGLQGPGSHREYRAGSSCDGDLSSFSCFPAVTRLRATETGTRCAADGQGGGRGPQESRSLHTHLGTWAPGQQRSAAPTPTGAALPSPFALFPSQSRGDRRGEGPHGSPFQATPQRRPGTPSDQGKEPPEAFQRPLPQRSGSGSECKANSGGDDEELRR